MATIKKSHEASWKPGGTAKHVIYLPVSYLVLFMKIDFNENIHIYSVHYINSPCNTCWLMNVHGNFTWLTKQNRYFYSTLQKPKVSEMHEYQPAQFYPLFFSHFPLEQWQRDAEPGAAPAISGPSSPFIRAVLGSRSSDRVHKGILLTAFPFFSNSIIFYYATKSKFYHWIYFGNMVLPTAASLLIFWEFIFDSNFEDPARNGSFWCALHPMIIMHLSICWKNICQTNLGQCIMASKKVIPSSRSASNDG